MTEEKKETNPCVLIAASIGGLCVGAIAVISIFVPSQIEVAAWITGALSIMGIALGYLSTK